MKRELYYVEMCDSSRKRYKVNYLNKDELLIFSFENGLEEAIPYYDQKALRAGLDSFMLHAGANSETIKSALKFYQTRNGVKIYASHGEAQGAANELNQQMENDQNDSGLFYASRARDLKAYIGYNNPIYCH